MFDYNLKRKIPKNETILETDKYMFKEEDEEEDNSEGMKVNYLRRPAPEHGLAADVCAGIGVVFVVIMLRVLYETGTDTPLYASALALCSILWAVAAVFLGVKGLTENNRNYTTSFIALAIGGMILIAWIIIFIIIKG